MTVGVGESPEAVRQAIRAILAAPSPSDVPPPIAEIDAYRAAAIRICEAEIPEVEKHRFSVALREDLRGAALADWCQAAVWEEVAGPLFGKRAPSRGPVPRGSQPAETRARSLLRAGYQACPTCLQPVTGVQELERLRRAREAEAREEGLRAHARADLEARVAARLAGAGV